MFHLQQTPAEITQTNNTLTAIFHRYGIEPSSNKTLAKAVGNPQFFLGLLNGALSKEDRNSDFFATVPLSDIVEFLFRSHDFYQSKRLPEISLSIENLTQSASHGHAILHTIKVNFEDFSRHLIQHFEEEEHGLFQQALEVQRAEKAGQKQVFSIEKVAHPEVSAINYIELIQQYLNLFQSDRATAPYKRILQDQLNSLSLDFELHEWVEKEVLIPRLTA